MTSDVYESPELSFTSGRIYLTGPAESGTTSVPPDVRGNGVPFPGRQEEVSVVEEVDMVNHPPHYTSDPSGVECITITRHRNFNIGNAIKYLWRAGLKRGDTTAKVDHKQIEDLEKAIFYINDEIQRLRSEQ